MDGFDVVDMPDGVEITWQLPDDQAQTHLIQVVVTGRDGQERLSLLPSVVPAPLWSLGSCQSVLGERCGLLTLGPAVEDHWAGRPLPVWADLVDRAVAAVRSRTGDDLVRVWLQLPATSEQLQELGAAPAENAAAGAWVMGNGPVHVLLDPVRVGALSDDEVLVLLTHEVVHVVTDAPRTDLPLWVEEGYAEVVTWADNEAGGWRQAEALLERIREEGTESLLIPTDDEFTGASAEPYARAWTLCRWLQETSDADDQWQWLRDWYGTVTTPTDEQIQQWRDWLVEHLERT